MNTNYEMPYSFIFTDEEVCDLWFYYMRISQIIRTVELRHSLRITDDSEPLVWRPVLITDVNSETTSDEEPPTAKFTWRYADNRPLLTLPTWPGIFTSPYNPVYS